MDLTASVARFEQDVAAFRQAANPDAAQAKVEQGLRVVAGKLSHLDQSLVPDDVLDRAREIEARAYDQDLEKRCAQLDIEERELWRAVQADLDAAATCPPDPALDPKAIRDDHTRLLAEMLASQRKDAALRQLGGKTLAYVRDEFVATPDARNPELVSLIETQVARGFVDLGLVPTREDADALMAIKDEIKKRRTQRVAERAPVALKVSRRIEELGRSAVTDTLRRHVRGGRGVANLPKRRSVRVPLSV
jgi:hypothetical protein